ncbi:hypothetical protein HWV62_24211 [Athelia sp. TMB]|nr:hypothetical protein HWV62_24211 [Athelia sp. TMB]
MEDPEKVARFTTAVARGLTSAGVAPSPKHFPGHGDTHVDSHLALPVIQHDLATLQTTALPPFAALIGEGTATVMTGHMALPLVTKDELPCSLSRRITTGLLRDEMGFKGVVVTDCLEMDAVMAEYGSEGAAVRALKAGADVVMICHTFKKQRGAVELAWKAAQESEWNAEEIKASSKRVRALKEKFAGTWEEVLGNTLDETEVQRLKAVHAELSQRAYAASIAVVRGPLPTISPGVKVFVLTPEMQSLNKAVDDAEGVLRTADGGHVRNTAGPTYLRLGAFVSARAPSSRHIVYSKKAFNTEELRDADVVLFVTRNADQSPWQLEHLESLLDAKETEGPGGLKAEIVVLQSCGPYDLLKMKRRALTVPSLACFEFTPPAFEAAVNVLYGDKEATGVVPVLGGVAYEV